MARLRGFEGVVGALANRNYGIWTAGSSISLIGTWMQRVGVAWLTWELTESGAWLGIIAFADLVPTFFIGPVAGVVADRWNRLRLTGIAQTLSMLQAVLLFTLTATDTITIELLLILVACLGVFHAFNQPARLALIPSLVRPENLPAAVAVNSIIFNVARFIGPALAGLIIVTAGIAATFAVNALSFAVFLFALTRIRIGRDDRGQARRHRNLFASLAEGVSYTVRHPGIGPLLIIMIATAICGRPFVELFAGFSDRVFGAGASGLAVLTSAVGAGAVLGGLSLTRRSDHRGLTVVMLKGMLALAMALLVFTATDRFLVAVPAAAVAGYCMTSIGVSVQTLMQMTVDGALRGRVLSLYGVVFRTGPGVGALIMGAMSEGVGLRWPVAGGAVLLLVTVAWTWRDRARLAAALESPAPTFPHNGRGNSLP